MPGSLPYRFASRRWTRPFSTGWAILGTWPCRLPMMMSLRPLPSRSAIVVYDTFEAGIPIPPESLPRCDFGHLFPHAGRSVQLAAHRMIGSYFNDACVRRRAITAAEKDPAGVYYVAIHYAEPHPGPWQFAAASG